MCSPSLLAASGSDLPVLDRDAALAKRLLHFLLDRGHVVSVETLAIVRAMTELANKMESVLESSSQILTSCVTVAPLPPSSLARYRPLAQCGRCSARTKLELKLRRTRERVTADVKSMTTEIESFRTKSEVSHINSYCDQLLRMKATMDLVDK